jgi:DUF971 family protein
LSNTRIGRSEWRIAAALRGPFRRGFRYGRIDRFPMPTLRAMCPCAVMRRAAAALRRIVVCRARVDQTSLEGRMGPGTVSWSIQKSR